MYCLNLTNTCYVCLEQKRESLINITSSLLVNKDIIHIIGCLPLNLGWMKTKQIILICEECCQHLRAFYKFLAMCLKNSALIQVYQDKLNPASMSIAADNEAELRVRLVNKDNDINGIKSEIQSEDEEIYTFVREPIMEESADVFVNVDDSLVKEEDTWQREEVDGEEESPMNSNSIESTDNESDTEIVVNTHDTDTDSESAATQVHTTSKKETNAPAKKSHKCLICSKSFSKKSTLQRHTRVHTGKKPYKCATCAKCLAQQGVLMRHMRTHTGEKPYKCAICEKSFSHKSHLVNHMRTHTGEKPHKCATCAKCFADYSHLVRHMRTHTGDKPHKC